MGSLTESRLIPIQHEADAYIARFQAREMATDARLDPASVSEIETAVAEIALNTYIHGHGGRLWLRLTGGHFELCAEDEGPGFAATHGQAPHGLGVGLAAAGRLMGELQTGDLPAGGAWVRARRSLTDRHRPQAPWSIAVALKPAEGETEAGDAYLSRETPDGLVVAVADGLGHGPHARCAALTALAAIAGHPQADLPTMLWHAHEAARATRGAVAAVVRATANGVQLAGLGNIQVLDLATSKSYALTPGCLGVRWQMPRTLVLDSDHLLLASDGIDTRHKPEMLADDPVRMMEALVLHAQGRDDALALLLSRSGLGGLTNVRP